LANKAGKRYLGTAIQSNQLADPKYVQILESQFDAITPENEMKWEVIQPEQGTGLLRFSDDLQKRAK
jgi:endo-1,4-beta-xylanase